MIHTTEKNWLDSQDDDAAGGPAPPHGPGDDAAEPRPIVPGSISGLAQARFLSTMSHELRTPLNVVIGFSDALMRDTAGLLTREQIVEYSASINDSGRQLLSLVDVILDVAKVESGQFELPQDLIDLGHLLAVAMNQAAPGADAGSVTLQSYLPPDLPHLRADERRLRQTLGHLMANAVKFTLPGGSVRLSARQDPTTGDLLILISDTGIGVADIDLERVFEPFVQLDASFARRFSGSGLGLYISRIVARAHGGELSLYSRLGSGTTAVLRLPASRFVSATTPNHSSQDQS